MCTTFNDFFRFFCVVIPSSHFSLLFDLLRLVCISNLHILAFDVVALVYTRSSHHITFNHRHICVAISCIYSFHKHFCFGFSQWPRGCLPQNKKKNIYLTRTCVHSLVVVVGCWSFSGVETWNQFFSLFFSFLSLFIVVLFCRIRFGSTQHSSIHSCAHIFPLFFQLDAINGVKHILNVWKSDLMQSISSVLFCSSSLSSFVSRSLFDSL